MVFVVFVFIFFFFLICFSLFLLSPEQEVQVMIWESLYVPTQQERFTGSEHVENPVWSEIQGVSAIIQPHHPRGAEKTWVGQ